MSTPKPLILRDSARGLPSYNGLEQFIDHTMVLFTIGRINYDRSGKPCTVRQDDFAATPTKGEIECVRKYIAVLQEKIAHMKKWAKRAEALYDGT